MTPAPRAAARARPDHLRADDGADRAKRTAFVGGLTRPYPETIRPAIQAGRARSPACRACRRCTCWCCKDRLFFFADTMVNIDPTADRARRDRVPRGRHRPRVRHRAARRACCRSRASARSGIRTPQRVAEAADLVRQMRPALVVDGEMHARHRRRRGHRARELPALAHPGRRQRAHLPEPRGRQHRLQAGAAARAAPRRSARS